MTLAFQRRIYIYSANTGRLDSYMTNEISNNKPIVLYHEFSQRKQHYQSLLPNHSKMDYESLEKKCDNTINVNDIVEMLQEQIHNPTGSNNNTASGSNLNYINTKVEHANPKNETLTSKLDSDGGKKVLTDAREKYAIPPNYYGITSTCAKFGFNKKEYSIEVCKSRLFLCLKKSKTTCHFKVQEVKEPPQINHLQFLAECQSNEETKVKGCGNKCIIIIERNNTDSEEQQLFWFATSTALKKNHIKLDDQETCTKTEQTVDEKKIFITDQMPSVQKVRKWKSESKTKAWKVKPTEDLDETKELNAARLLYQIPPYNKNSNKIFYGIETIKTDQIRAESLKDKALLRMDVLKILAHEKITCEVKFGDIDILPSYIRLRKAFCNHVEKGGCTNEFLLILTGLELRINTIHVYATTKNIRAEHLIKRKPMQLRGKLRDERKKAIENIQPVIAVLQQTDKWDDDLASKGNRTFLNDGGSAITHDAMRQLKSEIIRSNRDFVCPRQDLTWKQGNGVVVSTYFTDLNKKKIGQNQQDNLYFQIVLPEFQIVCVNKAFIDLVKEKKIRDLIGYFDATGGLVNDLNCSSKGSSDTSEASTDVRVKPGGKPCGKPHNETRILNYICAVEINQQILTAFEIVSSCYKTEDIERALSAVKDYFLKELGYIPIILYVSDYSEAQIHGLLKVFCGIPFVKYVNDAFSNKLDPKKMPGIALCHVHVIHRVAKHTKIHTRVAKIWKTGT